MCTVFCKPLLVTTEYISLQEMKQGQCICPLSWSVHYNFTRDGKCNKRGWACTPHPHQPSLILPSWLIVRQKADVTACDEELYCNGYRVQKRVRARSLSTQSSNVCLLAWARSLSTQSSNVCLLARARSLSTQSSNVCLLAVSSVVHFCS